ncbi:MAG: lytic transglycosylase [Sulfobacillus acidophilus]|uniref:Lytic transglycosylase n=1 Tax=Sulfobacillus acidophilus TaxID=53633 RepID=A0A2T2WDY8_9FIRM|nr:MAG: lytic transglycosylase [Sulfobacillus acidophilus]
MAKRRVRRVVRVRFAMGVAVLLLWAIAYGYWAPFPFQPTIVATAHHEHLSPYVVAAVIRVESRFRPDAVSNRGAIGLMQLMPTSAQWILVQMGRHGPLDLRNPQTNIQLGSWYLHYLLATYHGNLTLALAAYNGGPRTVDDWLSAKILSPHERGYARIPYPETANFVRRVRMFETVYRIMYVWV